MDTLEEKVQLLYKKVEIVCQALENENLINKKSSTANDVGQVPIRIKRLPKGNAATATKQDEQKTSTEANKDKVVRKDTKQSQENGNRPVVTRKAAGPKPLLTEKLMEAELSQTHERQRVPLNELGLRQKETVVAMDNRVKLMTGEKSESGKLVEGGRKKYRTPLTEDTPEKNNLPSRKEALAMRKQGGKQMKG